MIRRITADDADVWWQLRLRAVTEEPHAFITSASEERERGPEDFCTRLAEGAPHGDFVLGAWDDEVLVGTTGVFRTMRPKVDHRAFIWGMYVAPEARGRGWGRRLLDTAVAGAHAIDGVEWLGLSVTASNTSALVLYLSSGFTIWGTEPDALRVDGVRLDEHHLVYRG